jgi:heme A synthase
MDTPTSEAPDPIVEYIRANRTSYTRDAMRDRLIDAGHDPAAVDAALEADAKAATARPPSSWVEQNLRLVTALLVVAAYVGMWIVFALLTNWDAPGYVTVTTWVFAAVLGLFGIVSLVYVGMTKRLTAGGEAAIVGAMIIPIVLLLILAGLCVPFTRFR